MAVRDMGRVSERVRFGWEKLETLLGEANIRDLVTQYWEELWPYKDIPCVIDWDRFLRREAEGVYRVWTARVDVTLAGFCSFYVEPFVLAKTTLFAVDGGHFLSPAFRDNSRIGWRMWKTALMALKAEGVKVTVAHDNLEHPLMPFFLALQMQPCSIIYWGRLDA